MNPAAFLVLADGPDVRQNVQGELTLGRMHVYDFCSIEQRV